eukprot:GHVH01016419.1.p1 GENE.GHVH01016419.1~~GHVH01016419.1.p1  ORF type:complete len:365 (-),score=49.92 GHVH01016419.1:134-1228(-)
MPVPTEQATMQGATAVQFPLCVFLVGKNSNDDLPNADLHKSLNMLKSKYGDKLEIEWCNDIDVLPSTDFLNRVTFVFFCCNPSDRRFDSIAQIIPNLCPKLKYIHSRNAGINHFAKFPSILAAEESGVIVTNAKDCYHDSLAEWCLFACAYFGKYQSRLVTQKRQKKYLPFYVDSLNGASIAVIGYGNIGQEVGRLAKQGYKMNVTAVKATACDSLPVYADQCLLSNEANLVKVFQECQFVVCCLPLTEPTTGVISKTVIDQSSRNTIFINIGRGQNVDQNALVDALIDGRLRAAALDVFEEEPIPDDDRIWTVPDDRLLISPHCCDWTHDIQARACSRFVQILERVIHNEVDLKDRVNCKRGY